MRKETLKEFLSQKKISDAEFYAFLIGFGVSTGTTAFQSFSANASLLLGGGGLIADLYHYKSNGWQIPLPGDDQLLAVIGNASAEAFLRNFVSGSKDTTRGRFYHQVNKRSRATLLSKYGQYERALIDLFKGLDELEPDLKNGDQLSRAIALSNILRVKVLLRQLYVPNKLIDDTTASLLKKAGILSPKQEIWDDLLGQMLRIDGNVKKQQRLLHALLRKQTDRLN